MLHCLLLLLLFWIQGGQPSSSLLRNGLLALQSGDLPRAQSELEAAGKQDPGNPYIWTSLAEVYLRRGDAKQAQAAASKAETTGANNPVVWHALAMFYAHAADFKAAATWEAKYAASAHADSDALSRAAMLSLRAQDFSQAATLAEDGLKRAPRDPQLNLTLGVARYGQRRFEDAISSFFRVIAIDPSIEQPYLFLGRMLDQAGPHLPEITAAYENWLKHAPQSAPAHVVLAKALLASDPRSPRAEELLRQAIQLDPKDWESHYELGVLLENKHAYQPAAEQLELSIAQNPNEAMPHYHLARVYDRLGESDRAQEERQIHERLSAGTSSSNSAVNP